jgi:hypothetical protein
MEKGERRMNVQEMIDELNKIEDKTLLVCLADWNEDYKYPALCTTCKMVEGDYLIVGRSIVFGKYVCLDA